MTGYQVTLTLTKPQARALRTLLGWEVGQTTHEGIEYLMRSETRSLRAVLKKLEALNA